MPRRVVNPPTRTPPAPVVASYSLIAEPPGESKPVFVTYKVFPDIAIESGAAPSPVTSEAFTVAPEVVYSPTVLVLPFTTNRSDPDTARPTGVFNPVTNEAFTVAPEVVYSPIVPVVEFVTNKSDPDNARPAGAE